MVMVGGSARWQRGSLLEDFGHDGTPDPKMSAQPSRGAPRALWGLYRLRMRLDNGDELGPCAPCGVGV